MIQLTRLNGNPLVVNSDLIKYAEASPDTVLSLTNGEKILVLESCEEVVCRTIAYRARVAAESSRFATEFRSAGTEPAGPNQGAGAERG
jgi:flagellar protein FlbD